MARGLFLSKKAAAGEGVVIKKIFFKTQPLRPLATSPFRGGKSVKGIENVEELSCVPPSL